MMPKSEREKEWKQEQERQRQWSKGRQQEQEREVQRRRTWALNWMAKSGVCHGETEEQKRRRWDQEDANRISKSAGVCRDS